MNDDLNIKEIPLNRKDIKEELKKESKNMNTIGTFLIAHSYLFAFMRELFIYSNDFNKLSFNSKELLIKEANLISFRDYLIIHLSKNNLNFRNYNNIKKLNQYRNDISHRLLEQDIYSLNFKKELKSKVNECLKYCELFQKKLNKTLNKF